MESNHYDSAALAVTALTSRMAQERAHELVAIDADCVDEMRQQYSHVVWDAASFTASRRGKWRFSRVAISADCVVAFWIASCANDSTLHTHRVAVAAAWREHGIAREMFQSILGAARAQHIAEMTLTVSADSPAVRFYRKLGFEVATAQRCAAFIRERGHEAGLKENVIWQADRYPYYLLYHTL